MLIGRKRKKKLLLHASDRLQIATKARRRYMYRRQNQRRHSPVEISSASIDWSIDWLIDLDPSIHPSMHSSLPPSSHSSIQSYIYPSLPPSIHQSINLGRRNQSLPGIASACFISFLWLGKWLSTFWSALPKSIKNDWKTIQLFFRNHFKGFLQRLCPKCTSESIIFNVFHGIRYFHFLDHF